MKRALTLALALVIAWICAGAAAAEEDPLEAIRNMKEAADAARLEMIRELQEVQAAGRTAMTGQAQAIPQRGLTEEEQRALAELRDLVGASSPLRVVLVPAGEMEPERAELLAEDLAIMSRVLDKALVQAFDGDRTPDAERRTPAPLIGGRPRQTLYLDGYGVVFMLGVRFPLAGPGPAEPEEPEPKAEPESLWEQTKREMQAPTAPAPAAAPRRIHPVPHRGVRDAAKGPAFQAERVERLVDVLLDSISQASHVRALGPEEAVAIVVMDTNDRQEPGSALTVHTTKETIDTLAEGDMTAEEFRRRITLVVR